VLKWDFAQRRGVVPYFDLDGSVLLTSRDTPPHISHVNFTPSAAVGLHFLQRKYTWTVEFRFLHISDSSLTNPNPGSYGRGAHGRWPVYTFEIDAACVCRGSERGLIAAQGGERKAQLKAIQIEQVGGPEVLKLKEVVIGQPGPGQALVRIVNVGVNFVEIYQRSGRYPVKLPFIPGSEASGVVEQ